jgi:hypothetical protein
VNVPYPGGGLRMRGEKESGSARAKCLVLHPGAKVHEKVPDCRIKLKHDGFVLDYGRGDDFFRFSAISDLGFRVPYLETLNGLEEAFAIEMEDGKKVILGRVLPKASEFNLQKWWLEYSAQNSDTSKTPFFKH